MKMIKVGIWCGHGGSAWDDGCYNGIREITLKYDLCIDSIQVLYSDKAGNPVISQKHGGTGGNQTSQIKLQYPEEFLISISGYYSPVVNVGSPVIRSLTLKSNKRSVGPFGIEEGTAFTLSVDGGLVVGFYGRSGWYLDALGFYLGDVPITGNLYQAVQQKLQKLGTMASKQFGHKPTLNTPTDTSYLYRYCTSERLPKTL